MIFAFIMLAICFAALVSIALWVKLENERNRRRQLEMPDELWRGK